MARLNGEWLKLLKEEVECQIAMEGTRQQVKLAEWDVTRFTNQAALYAEEASELI